MTKRRTKEDSIQSPEISGNDDAIFERNCSIREIIRAAFADQGASPVLKDADLSKELSLEMLKVLKGSGASAVALQRQVQLFAAVTLLEIKMGEKPKPNTMADFFVEVMGLESAKAITNDDWKAMNATRTAMADLVGQPEWAAVHGGHVAMSCMSLLSLYDLSILNWRMPG